MTTKKVPRPFKCVHSSCAYRTEKRKSIYSHLVRTHGERKEDFECEYCSAVFTSEEYIEDHLLTKHSSRIFTYTCISRLENIINRCAKLACDEDIGPKSSGNSTPVFSSKQNAHLKKKNNSISSNGTVESNGSTQKSSLFQRTKASVNESLNKIAKQPKLQLSVPAVWGDADRDTSDITDTEEHSLIHDKADDDDGSCVSMDSDSKCQSFISKPSGLKIKINLSTAPEQLKDEGGRANQTTPLPLLEPNPASLEAHSLTGKALSPPGTRPCRSSDCKQGVVRGKASKYFDRLEVYHTTDRQGRRCCPFCPYKTTKNTIRVHLAGIHKIYFVKCSLCEYRAAFPHQIYQHGVKFHKTSNLKVIQLSKLSRDRIIKQLKGSANIVRPHLKTGIVDNDDDKSNDSNFKDYSYETIGISDSNDNSNSDYAEMEADEDASLDVDSYNDQEKNNEESVVGTQNQIDQRVFQPPKSQTSKTDYYTITIDNGVYIYNCKLCEFRTPVRSTIYTHKYRHEYKAYKCGYCEFTSAPRSNVVHHCRGKHKHRPICVHDVVPSDDEELLDNSSRGNSSREESHEVDTRADGEEIRTEFIKVIKSESKDNLVVSASKIAPTLVAQHSTEPLIKVPHFTRSTKVLAGNLNKGIQQPTMNKPEISPEYAGDQKMQMNRLYKLNPEGSPRYMCTVCSFACDTHPKMKHHLYRHRPQQYKCPYCDHRKYPRSYVVRHVRDTHRGKPIRVVDLAHDPAYRAMFDADTMVYTDPVPGDRDDDKMDTDLSTNDGRMVDIKEEPIDEEPIDEEPTEQNEASSPIHQLAKSVHNKPTGSPIDRLRQYPNCADLVDDMFTQTSDVSPNFHEAVFTSTPMIESLINRHYEEMGMVSADFDIDVDSALTERESGLCDSMSAGKVFEKKKSVKNYRVNRGEGPRYICNVCNYGTKNYKTIHNHMYRHEPQRYQCPYCGYRRSPRSFVETHIREIHKGLPVVVRELSEALQCSEPLGSPRQTMKMPNNIAISKATNEAPPLKKIDNQSSGCAPDSKPFTKWPAPKPASQVKLRPSTAARSPPPLQSHGKPKHEVILGPHSSMMSVLNAARIPDIDGPDPSITCPPPLTKATISSPVQPQKQLHDDYKSNPFKFKEASRTTFKTMYKCVFDPEVCNHISKDKSKMKQHLFMHVEYKPWTCDYCEMTASQSSHIKNHVRTEHPAVSEMSFKYKRHNYLEKHIDSFLSKGLFTVPINEYRAILDMKGNTKTACKKTFELDQYGFLLCPYCDYKTKNGGITDHVKMKHLQPRFKCHYCDFRAFYKSEVRKHHRKERSHLELEFKIQELDLAEMMAEYQERKGKRESGATEDTNDKHGNGAVKPIETSDLRLIDAGYYDDDKDEDNDDTSSNASSLNDGVEEMLLKYSDQQFSETIMPRGLNTEINDDGSMKLVPAVNNVARKKRGPLKGAKFKCSHCSFSADLRVKVKMHCGKRHPLKQLHIIELASKNPSGSKSILSSVLSNSNMSLNANDLKGTKFEQDLRKAGVAKLNLASLFPYNYRFSAVSPDSVADDDASKGCCDNEPGVVTKNDKNMIATEVRDVMPLQNDSTNNTETIRDIIEIPALEEENVNCDIAHTRDDMRNKVTEGMQTEDSCASSTLFQASENTDIEGELRDNEQTLGSANAPALNGL